MNKDRFQRIENIIYYSSSLERLDLGEKFSVIIKSVSEVEERSISLFTNVSFLDLVDWSGKLRSGSAHLPEDFHKYLNYLAYYLAHAVVFYKFDSDGYKNFLVDRSQNIERMRSFFYGCDFEILYAIFRQIQGIKQRDNEALEVIEDFSKTTFAKIFYKSLSSIELNTFQFNGIRGYENIPLSHSQLYILSCLRMFYETDIFSNIFGMFKFVVASYNKKGINSIEAREKQREVDKILEKRGDLRLRYKYFTKEGLLEDHLNYKSGKLDEFDLVVRATEMGWFNEWKTDKLSRLEKYNKSRNSDELLPIPSEEDLVREFVSIYKYSSWILDEFNKEQAAQVTPSE